MTEDALTAYIPVEQLSESVGEGDMVRIKEDAYNEANIDRLRMDEPTDDEYEYERLGFILETHTDDFNWIDPDENQGMTVEVADGESVHIVGLSHTNAGAHPFYDDQLKIVDRDEVLGDMDVDGSPDEMADEENATGGDADTEQWDTEKAVSGTTTVEELAPVNSPLTDRGNIGPPWPPSWEDANKPARLIAMDAWISMGRSFRGCRRTMAKSMANPNRFCARYKDSIYGHTYWREGGG